MASPTSGIGDREIEGDLQRLGGEGRAVVELDAGPELHRPLGEVVVRGDRLGEVRRVVTLVVEMGERVEDCVAHEVGGRGEPVGGGVQPARLGFDAVAQRPAALGLATRAPVAGVSLAAAVTAAPTAAADGHQHQHDQDDQHPKV